MNFNSKKINQYAFRKEYFGGLLLDFKNTTYELITKKEFSFLKKLKNSISISIQDLQISELNNFIKNLQQKKIIRNNDNGKFLITNIREIVSPKETPKNYLSAPLKVFDTYTRKCNLSCKHCYASSNPNFIEHRRTLAQTKLLMKKFYDVGVLEWRFTGGEPTITEDLFKVMKIANDYGMKVSLNTNACWSPETSKKILKSGVKEIVISLEGKENVNDIRRCPGVYKEVIKTLDKIFKFNKENPKIKILVGLSMTVGRDNIQDMEYVTLIAVKYGFNINFLPIKSSGRASKNLPTSMFSTKEYMEFARRVQQIREIPKIKKSNIKIGFHYKDLFCPDYLDKSNFPYPFNYSECSALTTAIDILPDGRIIACTFLMDKPEFIGPNILDVSVYDAWQHPSMEKFRMAKKQDCKNCKFYMKQCRGTCRSTVLLNGGKIKDNKLIGNDPGCFDKLLF